jgi:hypothetical protein
MLCGENQPTFQRNISPPFSWSKDKPIKKLSWNSRQAENGSSMFPETSGCLRTTRRFDPENRILHFIVLFIHREIVEGSIHVWISEAELSRGSHFVPPLHARLSGIYLFLNILRETSGDLQVFSALTFAGKSRSRRYNQEQFTLYTWYTPYGKWKLC